MTNPSTNQPLNPQFDGDDPYDVPVGFDRGFTNMTYDDVNGPIGGADTGEPEVTINTPLPTNSKKSTVRDVEYLKQYMKRLLICTVVIGLACVSLLFILIWQIIQTGEISSSLGTRVQNLETKLSLQGQIIAEAQTSSNGKETTVSDGELAALRKDETLLARLPTPKEGIDLQDNAVNITVQMQEQLRQHEKSIARMHDYLEDLANTTQMTNNKMEAALEKQVTGSPVFFTAYLTQSYPELDSNGTLKFDSVLSNEGDAYNSSTGIFTCPANGVYMFMFFINDDKNGAVIVHLVVNSQVLSTAITEVTGRSRYDESAGNAAIVRLRKGQEVWLKTKFEGHIEGTERNRYSTFSGVKLF